MRRGVLRGDLVWLDPQASWGIQQKPQGTWLQLWTWRTRSQVMFLLEGCCDQAGNHIYFSGLRFYICETGRILPTLSPAEIYTNYLENHKAPFCGLASFKSSL